MRQIVRQCLLFLVIVPAVLLVGATTALSDAQVAPIKRVLWGYLTVYLLLGIPIVLAAAATAATLIASRKAKVAEQRLVAFVSAPVFLFVLVFIFLGLVGSGGLIQNARPYVYWSAAAGLAIGALNAATGVSGGGQGTRTA